MQSHAVYFGQKRKLTEDVLRFKSQEEHVKACTVILSKIQFTELFRV